MSKYPDLTSGQRFTGTIADSMIPDVTVKGSDTGRLSNSLLDDPDLAGIALAIGTWHIRFVAFATQTASATADIRTRWVFTGTWNTPTRACFGQGTANAGAATAVTDMTLRGTASNADSVYGLPDSSTPNVFHEECALVTVTVAGNFAINWAQSNGAGGTTVTLKAGSFVIARQIA